MGPTTPLRDTASGRPGGPRLLDGSPVYLRSCVQPPLRRDPVRRSFPAGNQPIAVRLVAPAIHAGRSCANQRARRSLRHRPPVARWRRVIPMFAMTAVLVVTWFGAGALRSSHSGSFATVPGATVTTDGELYTVRAGDSLWSIATALSPSGDPRPIVDELAAELHGAPLVPGETLHLP
jgi:hypothetical protein